MKQVKNIVFIACLFLMTSITAGHAQVTIGSQTDPVGGALLDLKEQDYTPTDTTSSTRGLVFPRVKLTNLTELYPMYYKSGTETTEYKNNRATLKKKHQGLTVYNLNDKDGFKPGLYTWNGERWIKPVTELPDPVPRSINLMELKPTTGLTDVKVKAVTNTTSLEGGSLLFFNDQGYLLIPENGTYYFNMRLYGEHITDPSKYYVSVWRNGTVNNTGADATLEQAELMDKFEADIYYLNEYVYENKPPLCVANYGVNLCCPLKAGDKVRFKIGYEPSLLESNPPTPWTLKCSPNMIATRTTMFWWKL